MCILPEYGNMEAFLHISEVAPRWIKNIHEFISEGQQYVARINRIDSKKAQVDISLKRVSDDEKRRKLESVRQKKRSQKMLEFAMKSTNSKSSYERISREILKEYEDIYTCFEYVFEDGIDALKDVKIPQKIKEKIVDIAKINMKKSFVLVQRDVEIVCYGPEGVSHIKELFEVTNNDENINAIYLSAPKYRITIKSDDYKFAEKNIDKLLDEMKKKAKKLSCSFK